MRFLLFVALFFALAAAEERNHRESVQQEHYPDIKWSPSLRFSVPKVVFDFFEQYNWGDYHSVFHMARKYYFMGDRARQWLKRNNEKIPPLQEGDPVNGIEFLVMHRAMIQQLRDLFGEEVVTSDPDGRKTMNAVLDGWQTDEDVIEALKAVGGDVQRFERGLKNINDFDSFETEDEFGNFLQTSLRLVNINRRHQSDRDYDYDRRPGAGVHNWLHGQFHTSSPITVGDPRSNLHNIMFWRIHGWLENKWKQFEASRVRNTEEQELYDRFMKQFGKQMDDMTWEEAAEVDAAAQEEAARIAREEAKRAEELERKRLEQEAAERAEELERKRLENEAAEARRREEAERKRREEAERKRREEAERKRREEAERKRREEAERRRREEAENNNEEVQTESTNNAVEEEAAGEWLCAKRYVRVKKSRGWISSTAFTANKGDRVKLVGKHQTYIKVSKGGKAGWAYNARNRYFEKCTGTGRNILGVMESGTSGLGDKIGFTWKKLVRKLRTMFRKAPKITVEMQREARAVCFTDKVPCWRLSQGTNTPECSASLRTKADATNVAKYIEDLKASD